jgi:hypothetical protein
MKPAERNTRFRALVAAVQAAETEAHALGLHVTAHTINNAKNACGWEFSGNIEVAALASKGRRVGDDHHADRR